MQIKSKKEIKGNGKDKDYLQRVPGSIAKALNNHIKELEPFMITPSQLPQLKSKVNEIILSDEVGESFGKEKAVRILNSINNYNRYLSSLAAYMTGIAIGR